ncbi:hypothetical protein VTL71DRAFT_2021 [Oculimacula yallundae]|uniref:feruloyl esterase n=1 Tax=Oculimacula yallundae TaxID=86028 RepID=A0ABR4CDR4_9HELO
MLLILFTLWIALASASRIPYTNVSITSSKVARYYLLTLPPGFNPQTPTPVILSFHGGNRTADSQYKLSEMSNTSFNDFSIAVYPQGINKTWQGIPGARTNDIKFTQDILKDLSSKYTLDEKRIWATGKSQGGGFCGTLACDAEMSSRIAAFAPVSGAFYIKNNTECHPKTIEIPCNKSRQVPIIEFHGGDDPTIKYKGAGRRRQCLPSIPHWVEAWVDRDGLEGKGMETERVGKNATRFDYGGGIVSHVYDPSLEHVWPSTSYNTDNKGDVATFDASSIIVDFFKKHTL